MKLKRKTLERIIKQELNAVLSESRLLDRYSKDKEEKFRQYLRDMGKDPDEIIDTLGPAQADVMRQTLVGNFPNLWTICPIQFNIRGSQTLQTLLLGQ